MRGPQRSADCGPCAVRWRAVHRAIRGAEPRQQAGGGVDEFRLILRAHGLRADKAASAARDGSRAKRGCARMPRVHARGMIEVAAYRHVRGAPERRHGFNCAPLRRAVGVGGAGRARRRHPPCPAPGAAPAPAPRAPPAATEFWSTTREFRIGDTGLRTQQQKIISGAEAGMLQHAQGFDAAAPIESRLQHQQFAHRHAEAPRDRDARLLRLEHDIAGLHQLREIGGRSRLPLVHFAEHRAPQQQREQERGRDGLVGDLAHRCSRGRFRAFLRVSIRRHRESGGRQRKQMLEQSVLVQHPDAFAPNPERNSFRLSSNSRAGGTPSSR